MGTYYYIEKPPHPKVRKICLDMFLVESHIDLSWVRSWTTAVQQPWLYQNEHRGICYWLCPVPKEWKTFVYVLSKCFTNVFWGIGREQYWWYQITFPVSWLCGSSGWSCGKENIAKNPIMRLQIEREKMENLGRNLQLVVEKKKQFCENTAAVKWLLRSWKMILQIWSDFTFLVKLHRLNNVCFKISNLVGDGMYDIMSLLIALHQISGF